METRIVVVWNMKGRLFLPVGLVKITPGIQLHHQTLSRISRLSKYTILTTFPEGGFVPH